MPGLIARAAVAQPGSGRRRRSGSPACRSRARPPASRARRCPGPAMIAGSSKGWTKTRPRSAATSRGCACASSKRLAVQDHRRRHGPRSADLHGRRGRGITIVHGMPSRRALIGEALRMVAGRRRDHAARALLVGELQQLVERAALLVGGGELQVLEFQPHVGAGQDRKRLRMERRRPHDAGRDPFVGAADIGDGDAVVVGTAGGCFCGGHGGGRTRPSGGGAEGTLWPPPMAKVAYIGTGVMGAPDGAAPRRRRS